MVVVLVNKIGNIYDIDLPGIMQPAITEDDRWVYTTDSRHDFYEYVNFLRDAGNPIIDRRDKDIFNLTTLRF